MQAVPDLPEPTAEKSTAGTVTTLEELTAALDRLVLARAVTTEQARAVLRELALPMPQLRQPTLLAPLTAPRDGSPPEGIGGGQERVEPTGSGRTFGTYPITTAEGAPIQVAVPAGLTGEPPAGGLLEPDDAASGHRPWIAVLGEVGGYVGAAFVLGGCLSLAGPGWDTLSRTDRVLLLAGPALILTLVAAVIAWTTPGGWTVHPRAGTFARRRLVSTLVALGAGLTAGAATQLVHAPDEFLAAAGTATVICMLGYAACRGHLLHLAAGSAFALTASSAVAHLTEHSSWGDRTPWGLVLAGVVWVSLVAGRALAERTLGDVFGAVLVLIGGQWLAADRTVSDPRIGYLVIGLVAIAGIAGYLRTRRVAVLAVGVVALATVVPQVVTHYAGGSLAAGGALLVTGLSIVGASLLGLIVHRRPPAHRAGGD